MKSSELSLWTIEHTSIPIFGMCADDFLVTLMRAEGTIILMTLSDSDFVDGDDDMSFVASSRGPFEEALHGHSCLYGGMELGKRSIAIRGVSSQVLPTTSSYDGPVYDVKRPEVGAMRVGTFKTALSFSYQPAFKYGMIYNYGDDRAVESAVARQRCYEPSKGLVSQARAL